MIKAIGLGRGCPSSQKGWSILKEQRTGRRSLKNLLEALILDLQRQLWLCAMGQRSPLLPGDWRLTPLNVFCKIRWLQITTTEVLKPSSFSPLCGRYWCMHLKCFFQHWPSSQALLKSGKVFWWFYVHAEHEQQTGRNLWNHSGMLGRQNEKNSFLSQFLS